MARSEQEPPSRHLSKQAKILLGMAALGLSVAFGGGMVWSVKANEGNSAINAKDLERTGGVDLIVQPPNIIEVRRRLSGAYISEKELLEAATKRTGEETGCSIGSILPVEAWRDGVKKTDYLMTTIDCK